MTPPGQNAFGAADLERVVLEAAPRLVGARVRSVRALPRGGLLLGCEREEGAIGGSWLLLSLEPGLARAHLVGHPPSEGNRRSPAPFPDGLRARIGGARVAAIEAVPGDRVLRIDLEPAASPEGGAGGRLVLWLSFFATRADAVLEDAASGAVALSLREGSGRPLLSAGAPAARPPLFPDVSPDPATLAYSRALAERFADLESARDAEERRAWLSGELTRRRRKALGAAVRLREAVLHTARADEHQRAGEMLLASLHLVPKGASDVELPDYWAPAAADGSPASRRIALDPSLPAQEQAERFFQAAKKARRGAAITQERLLRFEREIAQVDLAIAALGAGRPAEEIARSLGVALPEPAGSRAPPPRKDTARVDGPGGPRRYRSKEGLEILVGRSNAENDALTTRIARSHDLFLHVTGFPGSHVIVRVERGKSAPLETILDAAALAVHFSKARGRPRSEVGYTPRKWVRKSRGSKPGLVLVERQKTVVVADAAERLRRLLATDPPADPPGAAGAGEGEG